MTLNRFINNVYDLMFSWHEYLVQEHLLYAWFWKFTDIILNMLQQALIICVPVPIQDTIEAIKGVIDTFTLCSIKFNDH